LKLRDQFDAIMSSKVALKFDAQRIFISFLVSLVRRRTTRLVLDCLCTTY